MKRKIFWAFVLILSIIVIIVSFVSLSLRPIYTQEYDVLFKVGDRIGFDIRSDSLSYGMLTPEGAATRDVLVTNTFQYDVSLNIMAEPSISGFVEAPESPYTISAGKNVSIPITIRIPSNASFGNYSGKIYFIFYKK